VRRADGDYTRLPVLAAELVLLAPDAIVSAASPATSALQHATSSIPIVMTSAGDPIGSGVVNEKNVHEVRWMAPDPADRSAETIPEPD
jgi:ABC-type uncharacterized transport system substrate-binding protein